LGSHLGSSCQRHIPTMDQFWNCNYGWSVVGVKWGEARRNKGWRSIT
jgi:hypothetical protein